MRRPDTGIPDVEFRGGVMRFGAESYSDDAAVLVADEQHLVQQLVEQDEAAARFKVRHVPSKEEYLFVDFTDPMKPQTRGIQEEEYKTAYKTAEPGPLDPGQLSTPACLRSLPEGEAPGHDSHLGPSGGGSYRGEGSGRTVWRASGWADASALRSSHPGGEGHL